MVEFVRFQCGRFNRRTHTDSEEAVAQLAAQSPVIQERRLSQIHCHASFDHQGEIMRNLAIKLVIYG